MDQVVYTPVMWVISAIVLLKLTLPDRTKLWLNDWKQMHYSSVNLRVALAAGTVEAVDPTPS